MIATATTAVLTLLDEIAPVSLAVAPVDEGGTVVKVAEERESVDMLMDITIEVCGGAVVEADEVDVVTVTAGATVNGALTASRWGTFEAKNW
jgi:hypothetical protein